MLSISDATALASQKHARRCQEQGHRLKQIAQSLQQQQLVVLGEFLQRAGDDIGTYADTSLQCACAVQQNQGEQSICLFGQAVQQHVQANRVHIRAAKVVSSAIKKTLQANQALLAQKHHERINSTRTTLRSIEND